MKLLKAIAAAVLTLFIFNTVVFGIEYRVRNLATFKGVRDNQLTGFGLVVGLKGTGDRKTTVFTAQAVVNMLKRFGINDPASEIKVRNVASVMVTATLPPFARKGDKIDVVVSSMGDAKALDGGVLLQTTLKGLDDNVYSVAQGPVSTGSGNIDVNGINALKSKTNVGRVPQGGIVEKEVPVTFVDDKNNVFLQLTNPDFTSASRITDVINNQFWGEIANSVDAGTIKIRIPMDFQDTPVEFVAAVEGLYVETEEIANKLVINERTGTIVMGQDVAIECFAVSYGNYNVNINVSRQISQPNPFLPGASAMQYSNQNIKVEGGGQQLVTLPQGVSVYELVNALSVLGASPRDIINILQAIKAAGALKANIEMM